MICPQGPDLRRSIGVVIPVLAPRFSWCLMDLTEVWGPTYILKGYTMTNTKERTYDDVAIAEAIHMANLEYDYDLVEELLDIQCEIEEMIKSGDTSSDKFFKLLKVSQRLTN